MNVLVSGASVAGTALAYWLGRHGFTVTVVERHDGLRAGGQAIDVRGPALDVLDKMGLLDAVAARKTAIRGMSLVDADGAEISRDTEVTYTGGVIDNPDIEILRDDLVALLFDVTRGTEYLFGDSVATLDERDDCVLVGFEHAAPRTFDLVIGADGLHSNVRRLAFGAESQFIKHMDQFVAICTAPNFMGLDHWQLWYTDESTGAWAGTYSARDNTESRVMFGFTDGQLSLDYHDVEAQRAEVNRRFAGTGRFVARLLEATVEANDFYCDEMAQILLDSWSRGRVGLVGDAAHCASPMSGQGTTLALLGAYVLAGELAAAGDDYRRGFASYEAVLHRYVVDNQSLAFQEDNDSPEAREEFYRVVNSFTLKDYPVGRER